MANKSWLGIAFAIIIAGLLVFFARPIAEFIVKPFFNNSNSLTGIASLQVRSGIALYKTTQDSEFQKINLTKSLSQNEHIKTDAQGEVEIHFLSGWKILLQPNSHAIVELYAAPDFQNAPALLTIVSGDYTVVSEGESKMLFISMQQHVFSPTSRPELAPQGQVRTLKIATPSNLKGHTNLNNQLKENVENIEPISDTLPDTNENIRPEKDEAPQAINSNASDIVKLSDNNETLSNQYIEKVLGTQLNAFRRCQMNSLRDNKPAEGSTLISITILPNGKVEKVKAIGSQNASTQLIQCVTSTIERVQFKTYDGEPITLNYPIEFK